MQCEKCGNSLDLQPLYFLCDELLGEYCHDCWKILGVRCSKWHEEGCETIVFNCGMDNAK